MDFSKIFNILNSNNIDKEEVFKLVDLIKNLNLEDEDNIREVIRKASLVAKKDINKDLEDKLVKKIKEEGLTPSLLEMI